MEDQLVNSPTLSETKLIDLSKVFNQPLFNKIIKPFEWALGLSEVNREYRELVPTEEAFFSRSLRQLQISYAVEERGEFPKTGGLLIVANHPYGAIDGMMLADWLRQKRSDIKILANGVLGNIPEIKDMIIEVNPFKGHAIANARGMAQAIKWLKEGHVLLTFPAGEVSSYSIQRGSVADSPWSNHIARLLRKSSAQVMPMYIQGHNSMFFQTLGLLHPLLRSLWLARELLNKRGQHFKISSGTCWNAQLLQRFTCDDALMAFLRDQTYAQARMDIKKKSQHQHRKLRAIVDPLPKSTILQDIQALPKTSLLLSRDHIEIYAVKSWEIPHILHEIGRLREVTFRDSGEGSGLEIDLDEHDQHYVHLFSWDTKAQCVVGAYRIGHTDSIIDEQGRQGLYSQHLFRMSTSLLQDLRNGLELGRSFIRKEYQKSRHGLPLIWQAILKYVVKNPNIVKLYGCVSICSDYQRQSMDLMIDYCRIFRSDHNNYKSTNPTHPYRRGSHEKIWLKSLKGKDVSPDELSQWISNIEPDQKGIPVLLKHYLRLGAVILDFNVDPSFGNVVDGLILIDLRSAERGMLERFMGKKEATEYLALHEKITLAEFSA